MTIVFYGNRRKPMPTTNDIYCGDGIAQWKRSRFSRKRNGFVSPLQARKCFKISFRASLQEINKVLARLVVSIKP